MNEKTENIIAFVTCGSQNALPKKSMIQSTFALGVFVAIGAAYGFLLGKSTYPIAIIIIAFWIGTVIASLILV